MLDWEMRDPLFLSMGLLAPLVYLFASRLPFLDDFADFDLDFELDFVELAINYSDADKDTIDAENVHTSANQRKRLNDHSTVNYRIF